MSCLPSGSFCDCAIRGASRMTIKIKRGFSFGSLFYASQIEKSSCKTAPEGVIVLSVSRSCIPAAEHELGTIFRAELLFYLQQCVQRSTTVLHFGISLQTVTHLSCPGNLCTEMLLFVLSFAYIFNNKQCEFHE